MLHDLVATKPNIIFIIYRFQTDEYIYLQANLEMHLCPSNSFGSIDNLLQLLDTHGAPCLKVKELSLSWSQMGTLMLNFK
jgi:hypothetical protein